MWIQIFLTTFLTVQFSNAKFDTSQCGQSKVCVFKPTGCVPYIDCAYAFSYQADDSKLYLELLGKVSAPKSVYISVGFSTDDIMGRDSVIVCGDQNNTGRFLGELAYNPGKSNRQVVAQESVLEQMLQTVSSEYNNGTLYCLIKRAISPINGVNTDQVFDLSTPYYILMASGSMTQQQTRVHNLDSSNNLFPYVSPGKANLVQMRSKKSESEILSEYQMNPMPTTDYLLNGTMHQYPQQQQQYTTQQPQFQQTGEMSTKFRADMLKVHAILMVIAWTFFFPIAIFFALFFKRHWPNTYIIGGNIWFQMHRVFNMFGIACTIVAFVCIFVRENWEWVGPSPTHTRDENNSWGSVHAMLGILACVVAWFQPIGAVFRCHPGDWFRFIFNIFHGFLGLGAQLMACAAIMVTVVHFATSFSNRNAAEGIYIAFVAVLGVCFILLTILNVQHWYKARSNVTAGDMELVQSDGKRHIVNSPETVRTHRIMNVVFIFFICVAIGATVSISVLLGVV